MLKPIVAVSIIAAVAILALGVAIWRGQRHREFQTAIARRYITGEALYNAAVLYAQAHQDRFPDAENWESELAPYLAHGLTFAEAFKETRFAYNTFFAGKTTDTYNQGVLFFESSAVGPSAHDHVRSASARRDHIVLVFASGVISVQQREWIDELRDPAVHRRLAGW